MKQIILTDPEINALAEIMDAGVRHLGLACTQNAAHLIQKIRSAQPFEPPAPDDPPKKPAAKKGKKG